MKIVSQDSSDRPLGANTDEDLLILISWKNDQPKEADDAFKEFYDRYENYLKLIISKSVTKYSKYHQDELKGAVFSNTLLKVFERAETFNANNIKDTVLLSKRIKAWLGRIATNELFMLLRELKTTYENEVIIDDFESDVKNIESDSDEDFSMNRPTFEKTLISGALASLNAKERDILLTCLEFDQEGKKLPKEVLDTLCSVHDTTRENIRQIKSRALKQVRGYIDTYKQNHALKAK